MRRGEVHEPFERGVVEHRRVAVVRRVESPRVAQLQARTRRERVKVRKRRFPQLFVRAVPVRENECERVWVCRVLFGVPVTVDCDLSGRLVDG